MKINPSNRELAKWFFDLCDRLKERARAVNLDRAFDKFASTSPAPVEAPHWSSTSEGHTKMLASLVCECGEAKQVGHYFCVPCREPRKR